MKKNRFNFIVGGVFSALFLFFSFEYLNSLSDSTTRVEVERNLESLTAPPEEPYPEERAACVSSDGNWNMASVCEAGEISEVTCTVSGEVSICGIIIKGSYTKGKTYSIAWARYKCEASQGNCCKKQGIYSGETKLA